MSKASTVRIATPADEASLVDLCAALHAENAAFPKDDDKVRQMLWRGFQKQGVSIGVIGPVGAIEAAIILMISSYWYSPALHLEELFNYVRPEHRKSHHAKSLLQFAMKCSDRFQLPLNIGVMSGRRTAAKVNLYRKTLGCYPVGAFFLYNSKWAKEECQPEGDGKFFWDNPFPRPGIKVVETHNLSRAAREAISRVCNGGEPFPKHFVDIGNLPPDKREAVRRICNGGQAH